MFRVRGMGVADRVRVSTCLARSRSFSLWVTPKRCSSSMTSKPRSWNFRSFCNSLWVPISRSTFPAWVRARMSRTWAGVRNRDSTSMFTGKERKRFTAVA